MAKKKIEEGAQDQSPDAVTERVLAAIEKDLGEGVVLSGDDLLEAPKVTIPLSPAIDILTSGGFQDGSWIGVNGPPKFCKTSLTLCLAAQAQRPEYGSRNVYYADIEGRLSDAVLYGTAGLVKSRPRFNVLRSTRGRLLTAQDYLRQLTKVLRDDPGAFVVLDSISALCDERELADGVGTETRGGGAKLLSQWIRMNMQVVPVQRSIVVGITHLISNTSGIGPPQVERAGSMWKYAKDYALRVKARSPWVEGGREVGYRVTWQCDVSKQGPPMRVLDSYVRFGMGIDRVYEAVQLGTDWGLIRKAGSWLTLDYLGETPELLDGGEIPKFNGAEKACQAIRGRMAWYGPLAQRVADRFQSAGARAAGAAGGED